MPSGRSAFATRRVDSMPASESDQKRGKTTTWRWLAWGFSTISPDSNSLTSDPAWHFWRTVHDDYIGMKSVVKRNVGRDVDLRVLVQRCCQSKEGLQQIDWWIWTARSFARAHIAQRCFDAWWICFESQGLSSSRSHGDLAANLAHDDYIWMKSIVERDINREVDLFRFSYSSRYLRFKFEDAASGRTRANTWANPKRTRKKYLNTMRYQAFGHTLSKKGFRRAETSLRARYLYPAQKLFRKLTKTC